MANKPFNAKYYERTDNSLAKTNRDLTRIKELWDKYRSSGLNSVESTEFHTLLMNYGFTNEHNDPVYYNLDEL